VVVEGGALLVLVGKSGRVAHEIGMDARLRS
jgi:hypothetical protein